MKTRWPMLATAVGLIAVVSFPTTADAAPLHATPVSAFNSISSTITEEASAESGVAFATTFQPSISGTLSYIAIELGHTCPTGPCTAYTVMVQIRKVSSTGAPSQVLASASVSSARLPNFVSGTESIVPAATVLHMRGVHISANARYAIAVSGNGFDPNSSTIWEYTSASRTPIWQATSLKGPWTHSADTNQGMFRVDVIR